ncbi:MAG: hypothetical protein K0B11_22170 [Mariniphaga sp.]|nr:hypothetical protein [Mariniphaga sp.]
MKKNKIFGLIASLFLIFSACETEVVDPAGLRGVGVVPGIEDFNPQTFDVLDLNNTFVQFKLVLDAPDVSEAIILVSFKGDKKRAEVTRVSSFPATVKIMLTDVVSKLGMQLSAVQPADVFNFEVQTIQGGQTYFSSAAFNAAVVCGYDPDMVTGNYHVISNSWGMEGTVTITVDPDDEFVIYVTGLAAAEGLDEDAGPLKMVVNPLNYSVTAERTALASSLAPWGLPYTGYWFSGSGELNTCDGTYTMGMTIGVDQGTFGGAPHDFTFTKN